MAQLPDGPTGLIGDDDPPSGFLPSAEDPSVWVLDGPVPDSLAGLEIGAIWDGISGAMTVYPWREWETGRRVLQGLIHEAFHTYQRRQPEFSPGFRFGEMDTTLAHAQLSSLEGELLADAMTGPESLARRRAVEALAIRHHKCSNVAEVTCANVRGVELPEGTADYVSESVAGGAADAGRMDSLATALRRAPSEEMLDRWWFYLTGKAWLYLVDRWSEDNEWTSMLPERAPHQVLERILGAGPDSLNAIASVVLDSEIAHTAFEEADSVRGADRVAADSVAAAFAVLEGTRVRIEVVFRGRCLESSTSQRGRWYEVDRSLYVLQEGYRGARYDNGRTWYEARGALRLERGALTVVVPGDIIAQAPDGIHRLDRSGITVEGPVVISSPNLEIHAEDATVSTTAEDVRVALRLSDDSEHCR